MTKRRCKPIVSTLAACFIVAAPGGTAVAELQGDWAAAVAASNRGDYATAQRLILLLAEKGDADAQYDLGVLYQTGEGVPADYVQAYKWYHLAASRFTASEQSMSERAVKIAQARKLASEWKATR
jgi:hypothetical protein